MFLVWAWDLVLIRLHCCGLPAPATLVFFALVFFALRGVTVVGERIFSFSSKSICHSRELLRGALKATYAPWADSYGHSDLGKMILAHAPRAAPPFSPA